jgi:dolichyl-phosphate-mannose-protein mannosyltransferase
LSSRRKPPTTRPSKSGPAPAPAQPLNSVPHAWAVPILLAIFTAAAAYSLTQDSATFDEGTHLGAGYAILDRHDFRLNPDHPPLSRVWAALPVWLSGMRKPDYNATSWRGWNADPNEPYRTGASQEGFGFALINGPPEDPARLDPMQVLVPARLMILVPGILLGLLVYRWAREIWGRGGALTALFFFCLSPSMLAHTRLVTTDMFASLGFTATFYAFWRFCGSPGWKWALLTGLALGGALLSKYSSVALVPILGLLGLAWAAEGSGEPGAAARRLRMAAGALVLALAVAFACIWAGYGFRYAASPEPDYRINWSYLRLKEGAWKNLIDAARAAHLAPEAALYSVASLPGGSKRNSFLNGRISDSGWWYYLPEAFLLKTPPALLILLAALAGLALARRRLRSFDVWYLVLPVALYFAVSMLSRMSIGHRHIVPVEPLLLVAAGGLATVLSGPMTRVAAGVAAAGFAVSFAAASPDYLSYFNILAGGPKGGWRYLVDSNVDWGQDLVRLRRWMRENDVPSIYLSYFGTGDPKAVGISTHKVYNVIDFYPAERVEIPRSGDYLAASATMLQGPYLHKNEVFADAIVKSNPSLREAVGRWLEGRVPPGEHEDGLASWMIAKGLITEAQRREVESRLLYAWLEHVRDDLAPVGRVGNSIFVYRMP